MTKIKLLTLTLMVAGVSVAFGQTRIEPSQWADKEIEKIERLLPELSDVQKNKIREASISQFNEMNQLREEQKEAREERKQKMQDLRKKRMSTYKEVLTQEQYVQLLENKLEKRERGDFRRSREFKRHRGSKVDKDFRGRKEHKSFKGRESNKEEGPN